MAYLAVHIAAAFIERGIAEKKPLTLTKLQHLVYCAHGYHLGLFSSPLLSQRFEAGPKGPEIHTLNQHYKRVRQLVGKYCINLNTNATYVVQLAWKSFTTLSAGAFSKHITCHGSPWSIAKAPQHKALYIENKDIKAYFEKWCLNSNVTNYIARRYIIPEPIKPILQIRFAPLMCPHCKTAPCITILPSEKKQEHPVVIIKKAMPANYRKRLYLAEKTTNQMGSQFLNFGEHIVN